MKQLVRTTLLLLAVAAVSAGTAAAIPLITSNRIEDNTIQSIDIKDGTLKPRDFDIASVGAPQIAPSAVHASEIAAGAVGAGEIIAGGVGASEIQTGAVRAAEIAGNAVGSSEIVTDAVHGTEIAAGSVGMSELVVGAVGYSELGDGVESELRSTAAVLTKQFGTADVAAAGTDTVTVSCGAGQAAFGAWAVVFTDDGDNVLEAGELAAASTADVELVSAIPLDIDTFQVRMTTPTGGDTGAVALCARA